MMMMLQLIFFSSLRYASMLEVVGRVVVVVELLLFVGEFLLLLLPSLLQLALSLVFLVYFSLSLPAFLLSRTGRFTLEELESGSESGFCLTCSSSSFCFIIFLTI
jgi:hypothetical protein